MSPIIYKIDQVSGIVGSQVKGKSQFLKISNLEFSPRFLDFNPCGPNFDRGPIS